MKVQPFTTTILEPSEFPGIAKVKPSKKVKRATDKDSSGGRGGRSSVRSGGSSKAPKPTGGLGESDRQLATRQEAIAWGRLGASFGTGIDNIDDAVEFEFHDVAIAAYNRRVQELEKLAKSQTFD